MYPRVFQLWRPPRPSNVQIAGSSAHRQSQLDEANAIWLRTFGVGNDSLVCRLPIYAVLKTLQVRVCKEVVCVAASLGVPFAQ